MEGIGSDVVFEVPLGNFSPVWFQIVKERLLQFTPMGT